MSELKPCAWCGAPAELVPDEDGSVFIECDHLPWCVFTGSDTRMWFYGEDAFNDSPAKTAYEVAAEAWNRRAERTCRNVARSGEDGAMFECSECGKTWHVLRYEMGDWLHRHPVFCPECGARVTP